MVNVIQQNTCMQTVCPLFCIFLLIDFIFDRLRKITVFKVLLMSTNVIDKKNMFFFIISFINHFFATFILFEY